MSTVYFNCLIVLRFNIPVNNFSVMLGWSNRFLGINQYCGELKCLAQGLQRHPEWGSDTEPFNLATNALHQATTLPYIKMYIRCYIKQNPATFMEEKKATETMYLHFLAQYETNTQAFIFCVHLSMIYLKNFHDGHKLYFHVGDKPTTIFRIHLMCFFFFFPVYDGLSHCYHLGESTDFIRGIRCVFNFHLIFQ